MYTINTKIIFVCHVWSMADLCSVWGPGPLLRFSLIVYFFFLVDSTSSKYECHYYFFSVTTIQTFYVHYYVWWHMSRDETWLWKSWGPEPISKDRINMFILVQNYEISNIYARQLIKYILTSLITVKHIFHFILKPDFNKGSFRTWLLYYCSRN